MAAYAALVSLMQLIEQIQHHHPNPPISLDQQQAKSLTEKLIFLQSFLEDIHSRGLSEEIQALERRIADAAHAAEDVIESQILLASGSTTAEDATEGETSADFYGCLQRVIQDMESTEKEAMDTKSRVEGDQLSRRSKLHLGSSLIEKTTTMVGFDHMLIQIMDRLTRVQPSRDIVVLVGMGGSGKTTLARNIYENPLIMQRFDMRGWATVSQECDVREVLIDLLLCQRKQETKENLRKNLSRETDHYIGEELHKGLFGKRYLVVLDDLWDIEAWNRIKFFFPDNNNGSRIMITIQLMDVAFDLTGSQSVKMNLAGSQSGIFKMEPLDEGSSWDLLCKKAFVEKSCPLELEEIGRKISRNCRGLPLSIVTIGGLLAKSNDDWEHVAKNLSSLVNSEEDEHCLRILSLSYIHLPVHLKPCFLYMGLFLDNQRIEASYLIKLWVAEGFLKPISGKALEVVGKDYLKDLVTRNLVSVDQWGFTGEIKYCVVHDLLRDMCLRKAQSEGFLFVKRNDNLRGNWISPQRRIAIHCSTLDEEDPFNIDARYSTRTLRSCIIDHRKYLKLRSLISVRLLRILAGVQSYTNYDVNEIVPLVNLRFLSCNHNFFTRFEDISFFWSLSWNLKTLVVHQYIVDGSVPCDIWKMPQLRHVKIDSIDLSDPPPSGMDGSGRVLALENLQTLSRIQNFKCGEEVVKRIPNIKRLSIFYDNEVEGTTLPMEYCHNNIERLQNLESVSIAFSWNRGLLDGFTLPYSLKKLTLCNIHLSSDMMSTMIGGSLPHLEVLKLRRAVFIGDEWNPVEDQFCSLKYLELDECELRYWNAENTHFPRLEHLRILWTYSLSELPLGIGDMGALRLIELSYVSNSLIVSAKRMLVVQEEELGNAGLRIRVFLNWLQEELESLASYNFEIYSDARPIAGTSSYSTDWTLVS